jgi:hypothetical protein
MIHGGIRVNQLENIISLINRNFDALFLIQVLFIVLLIGLLFFVWNITRKKYRNLRGEIPADALNNYLDSLKQNTDAVNSAPITNIQTLAPVPAQGTPAVMPLNNIEAAGQSVGVTSGMSSEELNEKNAEIAQLRSLLDSKNGQVTQLENKLVEESMNNSTGGEADPEAIAKVQNLQKEKAELEEKLKVYEVIDDDIAELSKLRKENEELKKSLGQDDAPEAILEEESPLEVTGEMDPIDEPEEAPVELPEDDLMPDLGGGGDLDDILGAMDDPMEDPVADIDASALADDLIGGDDLDSLLPGDDGPAEVEALEETPVDAIEEPGDAEDDGKSVEVKETDTPDDLLSQFEELLG